MRVLGIDPGKSGGMAILPKDGVSGVNTAKLSVTEAEIAYFMKFAQREAQVDFAMIERVHAMPKQGVSSTFSFGQSYGFLRGCLISLGIPFEEVTPGKWQRSMGCLSKGDKNVTKARAQQLFPRVKVTHAIADALLIAEYCRRVRCGELAA